ncbi:MAG: L,D-transpeptidase family protein [Ilumatobacteraceae bacterium]
MEHRRSTRSLLLILPLILAAGLASCSRTQSTVSAQRPDATVTVSPLPAAVASSTNTIAASTTGTTTPADPSTVATAAEGSTTTEAPTTTAAAPETTVADAPPPTLPSNVHKADWAPQEIQAVGSRSGASTAALQQRLIDLGFWVPPPDGKYGFATTQAVMAFQKYAGLPANGRVDSDTAFALTFFSEKAHGTANAGTMVEVDKAKQLLFIVVDGQTLWAFNTSTGSGIAYSAINHNDPTITETGDAQTPNGLYKTTRERSTGWWDGDLGSIYRPKYFNGGIAVHGMTNVPNHPASHGCVRVSVPAMDFIWDSNLVPLRTMVWVHS